MAKHWIAGAIKHPGALRATAQHMGLVHGDQKLSRTILGKISSRTSDTRTKRRVALAETLGKMRHG